MDKLLTNLKIQINSKIYLKDPETTDLGKRIITESIVLINEIGFEQYTFKKLGILIGSNESSIYRYFENKHKLLLYLASWYWGWIEYKLVIDTLKCSNPNEKLDIAIGIVTKTITEDSNFSHINEVILQRIVIAEFSKSYLTKEVDMENKEGYFAIYKRLAERLKQIILEVRPDYLYAASLTSTILEGSLHQQFLQSHFKSLTDCNTSADTTAYFKHLIKQVLS